MGLYDFSRPATLPREHARRLEVVFETFARQWATQLSTRVTASANVTAGPIALMGYGDYAGSLPEDTTMALVRLDAQEAMGVVQFPAEAALSWVGRMLGGTDSTVPSFRKLTDLEQSLIRRLTEEALEHLAYSFGPLLVGGLHAGGMHFNSRVAQAGTPGTLMLVASFVILTGGNSWAATVALPAQAVLAQLDGGHTVVDGRQAERLLRGQVAQAPVDVAMEMTGTSVRASTVLDLAVGDVLALPHPVGRPFNLTLEGKTVARAVGVTHGSRQGGQIVSIEENTA